MTPHLGLSTKGFSETAGATSTSEAAGDTSASEAADTPSSGSSRVSMDDLAFTTSSSMPSSLSNLERKAPQIEAVLYYYVIPYAILTIKTLEGGAHRPLA